LGLETPRLEPVKTVVRLCKKHWANIATYFRHHLHLSNAPDELVRVPIDRVLQPVDLLAVPGA